MHARKNHFYFFIFFLVFCQSHVFADGLIWQSTGRNKQLSVVTDLQTRSDAFYFFINKYQMEDQRLALSLPANTGLLINASLWTIFEKDTTVFLDNALVKNFAGKSDTIVMSVFGEIIKAGDIRWSWDLLEDSGLREVPLSTMLTGEPRQVNHVYQQLLILCILVLGFTALVKNSQARIYHEVFNLRKLFSLRMREESTIAQKPLNANNLLLYSLLAMLQALVWIQLDIRTEENFSVLMFLNRTFSNPIYLFVFNSATFLGMIGVKFIFLYYLSKLFYAREIAYIHFLDHVRINTVFFSALLILLFLTQIYAPASAIVGLNFVKFFLLILLIFRLMYLYVRLKTRFSIKNSYLISYLCTTEILPAFISLKVLISL